MESLQGFDLGILYFLGSLRRPWLDEIAVALATLGNPWPMTAFVVALTLLFVAWRPLSIARS